MRLKLLYNPAAGRGRAAKAIPDVEARLRRGGDVDVYESRAADHLRELAAASEGYDRIVACGGDGTVHHVLNGLDLARATLAIVPLGSGDDFAETLGIPSDVEKACDVALGGIVREIDVAMVNETRYVAVAGMGFDSEVARFANEEVKRLHGSLSYLYATLRTLARFEPRRVRFSVDGVAREAEIMFAVVGNSPRYGGGIRIAPEARVDDGVLDLYLIHKATRLDLVVTLPLAYFGKHTIRRFVEHARGREFSFEGEPLDVYADGEFVSKTPVKIRLASEKLRVSVPSVSSVVKTI